MYSGGGGFWIIIVTEKLGDNPLPYPFVAFSEDGAIKTAQECVPRLSETGRITVWIRRPGGTDAECIAAFNHRGERL